MVYLDLKTNIGEILSKYPKAYTTLRRLGIPRSC